MKRKHRYLLAKQFEPADVPVVEISATTRRNEARTVMTVVRTIRDEIGKRRLVVVVPDLDDWEEPLYRAAVQQGILPTFWTQIRLHQTRPFGLLTSLCSVLEVEEPELSTLVQPLRNRWSPPTAKTENWPIQPTTLDDVTRAVDEQPRTLTGWHREFRAASIDERITTYTKYLSDQSERPTQAAEDVLSDAISGYRRVGIPETESRELDARPETRREVKACEHLERALPSVVALVQRQVREGVRAGSWEDIAEMLGVVAQQRPGSRCHDNLYEVDILESKDVVAKKVDYAVVAGLVTGEWPATTDSDIPPELREVVLSGDGAGDMLCPRLSWSGGQARDQFAGVLEMAREGLVVTYHNRGDTGGKKHPSAYLDDVETERVSDEERQRLLRDREMPSAIRRLIDGPTADNHRGDADA